MHDRKILYLNRQTIAFDKDNQHHPEPIRGFQLSHPDWVDGCNNENERYFKVTSLLNTDVVVDRVRWTDWSEGADKEIIYLNRHHIQCNNKWTELPRVLTFLKLHTNKPGMHGVDASWPEDTRFRFEYHCASDFEGSGDVRQPAWWFSDDNGMQYTPWDAAGLYLQFLDRHEVMCPPGNAIAELQADHQLREGIDEFRWKFRCIPVTRPIYIKQLIGEWVLKIAHNGPITHSSTIGVTKSNSEEYSEEVSKTHSTTESTTIGRSTTVTAGYQQEFFWGGTASVEASNTWSQDHTSTVSKSTASTIGMRATEAYSKAETDTFTAECDGGAFNYLWQWMVFSVVDDGHFGPIHRTERHFCGHTHKGPQCAFEDCLDEECQQCAPFTEEETFEVADVKPMRICFDQEAWGWDASSSSDDEINESTSCRISFCYYEKFEEGLIGGERKCWNEKKLTNFEADRKHDCINMDWKDLTYDHMKHGVIATDCHDGMWIDRIYIAEGKEWGNIQASWGKTNKFGWCLSGEASDTTQYGHKVALNKPYCCSAWKLRKGGGGKLACHIRAKTRRRLASSAVRMLDAEGRRAYVKTNFGLIVPSGVFVESISDNGIWVADEDHTDSLLL